MYYKITMSASSRLLLGFSTQFGRLVISPDESDEASFILSFNESATKSLELGKYRTINDAIQAVVRQETGFLPWDALSGKRVPHHVHDIAY